MVKKDNAILTYLATANVLLLATFTGLCIWDKKNVSSNSRTVTGYDGSGANFGNSGINNYFDTGSSDTDFNEDSTSASKEDKIVASLGLFDVRCGSSSNNECWAHAAAGIINWVNKHENNAGRKIYSSRSQVHKKISAMINIRDDMSKNKNGATRKPSDSLPNDIQNLIDRLAKSAFKNGTSGFPNIITDLSVSLKRTFSDGVCSIAGAQRGLGEMRALMHQHNISANVVSIASGSTKELERDTKAFLKLYFDRDNVAKKDIPPLGVCLGNYHWILLLGRLEEDSGAKYIAYNSSGGIHQLLDEDGLCERMVSSTSGSGGSCDIDVIYFKGQGTNLSEKDDDVFTFSRSANAVYVEECKTNSEIDIKGLKIPVCVNTSVYRDIFTGERFYSSDGKRMPIGSSDKKIFNSKDDSIISINDYPIGWVKYPKYSMPSGGQDLSIERYADSNDIVYLAVPVYRGENGKLFVASSNLEDFEYSVFDDVNGLIDASEKGFMNPKNNGKILNVLSPEYVKNLSKTHNSWYKNSLPEIKRDLAIAPTV